MRVAIYARVSTESQQQRGTIGSQVALLRERVIEEGDELVAEFCDDGHSGARLDRPGLDALRDAAQAGLIERVWCLSPDRLARVPAQHWPTRSSCWTNWPATGSACGSPTPHPWMTTPRPSCSPRF